MKKFFRFFAIAAIACGMMTACGGDDPEDPNNGGQGGAEEGAFQISAGSHTWTPNDLTVVDFTTDDYMTIIAYNVTPDGQQYTQMLHGWVGTTVGQDTYAAAQNCIDKYQDENYIWTDSENALGQGVGDYWGLVVDEESYTANCTAIDINAAKGTITFQENAYELGAIVSANGADAVIAGTFEFAGDPIVVKGDMNNFQWEWTAASK